MNKLKSKKAFSIIEVVLVLAVAGLIMLAMFIAIPAMQRSRRNTERKDDMARIMKAVTSYQGNHNGKAPIFFTSTPAECSTVENAKSSKSCFQLDTNFVTKYVDNHASYSGDEPTHAGAGDGFSYFFDCGSNGCPDFTDPDGTVYVLKTEGRGFSGGNENMNAFDHVIHMAAYSKCSATAGTDDQGSGTATPTNDPTDVSIIYRLEGNNAPFCVDNQ